MSSVILVALMIVDEIATYSLKLGKTIKLSLISYGDSNLPLCICFTKANHKLTPKVLGGGRGGGRD